VIDLLGLVVDLDLPLAGHGYDVGGPNVPDADDIGDDPNGGLGAPWILAATFLALSTVGLLVWLNPSGAMARLRTYGPKALIVLIIAAPLVAWTASSRDDGEKSLTVERWTALDGTPELLVSLGDKALNVLATTNGKRVVRVKCVDRDGRIVLDAKQKWPFIYERGYEYAHAHQKTSRQQLQRADRCRLQGTLVRLEAAVKGALAP
jgi:hypothetical protein